MNIGRIRTLQSPKYANKKRKKLIFLVFVSISLIFILLILLILVLHLSLFKINSINISGADSVSIQNIEKTVKSSIDGSYLYIIPRSSFIFYPKSEIRNILINDYPEIKDLDIKIKGLTNLNIDIDERKPEVIVCEGFRNDENDGGCYYSDAGGFVYGKAASTTDSNYFKYYVNQNSTTTIMGSYFTRGTKFIELQKFIRDIANSGIKANGILVSDDNSYELYIENFDESDAIVYFDDRTSFDKTLSNLVVFWKNVVNKKIGLSVVPNFDYINLRFGNNVFYLVK